MSFLYDANAFLDLVKRRRLIADQYILDLTIYEVSNAIWKEVVLFKNLTRDEAIEFMNNIINIMQKMNIICIEEDLDKIMSIAIEEELTFYDAAYLYAAMKNKLTLVTNDEKLYSAARSKVNTIHSNEI